MQVLMRPWGAMHYQIDGPDDGLKIVFANSLGTDLRLWDAVLPLMPGIRAIRYDKRGHGLSDFGGAITIGDLAEDAAALIEIAGGPVVFAGLSVGGMIGQALAAKRPEMLRALVLSNTAARMGTPEMWNMRIDSVRQGGLVSIADAVMERWFAPAFRTNPEAHAWRNMMIRTDERGYIAACEAIASADLTRSTATLDLPALVISGGQDGASPPDLVCETANLISDATYHIIPEAGHLPCVETPHAWAALLTTFLQEVSNE